MDHRMSLRRPVRHLVIVVILVLGARASERPDERAVVSLPGFDSRSEIHGLPLRASRNSFRTTALLCASSFAA